MKFKHFCENTDFSHEDDQYEEFVASYIFYIMNKSTKEFFDLSKKKKLSEIVIDNSGGKAEVIDKGSKAIPEKIIRFHIPQTINGASAPKHLYNEKGPFDLTVDISPKSTRGSYGGGADALGRLAWRIKLPIDISVFQNANSYQDPSVQMMLLKLQKQLVHEATHISSGKSSEEEQNNADVYVNQKHLQGSDEYNRSKINYYTGPAEIRAHARQFALLYSRYFPNQPFNMENMNKISNIDDKFDRYFKGFEEKGHSQIWGNINVDSYKDQLLKAKSNFVPLVQYFVDNKLKQKTA
jgi:hypothetical protein